jgi:hypothetical protein
VVDIPPERALGGDGFAIDRLPKMNKKGRKGAMDDIRRRRVGVVCGSLREVHLLFRGVLQTRHQVTAARLEIRDPTPSQGDSQVLLVHAELVPVWPMAPSQPFFLLMNAYFNTRPPSVIPHGPSPHSEISSFIFIQNSPPSRPALNLSPQASPLTTKPESTLSKKALLEHGSRPLSALS